jgi:hypothetical protein
MQRGAGGRPWQRRARAACTVTASAAASSAWSAGSGRDQPVEGQGRYWRRWRVRQLYLCRRIVRELQAQQVKLPVANHRQRARRRAGARREEVKLQQSRPRLKTNLASSEEVLQVVA